MPLNIIESLFTGLPVVAFDNRGVRDLKGKYVSVVPFNDIQNLKMEILKYYQKRQLKRENNLLDSRYLLMNVLTDMQEIYQKNMK